MTDPGSMPANTDRALIRRRAGSALRQAGRTHLASLGLRPVSSSPRRWIGDHGWWVINVEFQPSGWSVGAYLNVGIQYLWMVTDVRSFGHVRTRVPIPGCGQFADLAGSEDDVLRHADAVGRAARDRVIDLGRSRRSEDSHLQSLSGVTDAGVWERADSAIASALLGRGKDATTKFLAIEDALDRTVEWQKQLASDCKHLAHLALDPGPFRSEMDARITTTRRLLRLSPRND